MKRLATCVLFGWFVCAMYTTLNHTTAHAAIIDFEEFNLQGALYLDVPSPLIFNNVGGTGVNVEIVEGADNRIYDLYQFGGNPDITGQALIDWPWSSGSNPSGTTITHQCEE